MPRIRDRAWIGVALAAGLMSARLQAMGLPPNCLETLAADSRRWTECTQEFDRQDSRCKMRAGRMYDSMQRCEGKGYSKQELNAAMTVGFRSAGAVLADHEDPDAVPAAPQPRPQRGPIPGFTKPEGN